MFGWFARRAGSLGLVVVVMSALMGPVLSASADPTPDTTAATDTPTALTLLISTSTPTVAAGSQATYAVSISNPDSVPATLVTLVDTLPVGFSYVTGTTSGAFATDPVLSSDGVNTKLTWTGSVDVPAAGSGPAIVTFDVTVATLPGMYRTQVDGIGGPGVGTVISDVGDAVITVTPAAVDTATPTPTPSDTPTPTPSDLPASSTTANPPANPPPSNPPATTASSAPSTSAEPTHPSSSSSSANHPSTPHPSATSSPPVEKAPAASEIDAHGIREVEISLASTSSLSAHRLSTTGAQVRTAFYVSLAAILAGSVLLLVGFVRRGGSRSR